RVLRRGQGQVHRDPRRVQRDRRLPDRGRQGIEGRLAGGRIRGLRPFAAGADDTSGLQVPASPIAMHNVASDAPAGIARTAAHPPRRRRRWASWLTMAAIAILATVFFLYLLVPIVALLVHAPPQKIWAEMKEPDVQDALR